METKRLYQFKCVVDLGGLLKAGEILGISAGGLSKSLKTLEYDLGYDLFYRNGRDLQLTDLGETLYSRLPEVLSAIDGLSDLNKSVEKNESPVIRFTSFEVFTTYFLSDFINKNLTSETVEISERTPGAMEELIINKKADIGITYEPIARKGLDFLKVSHLYMGIYGVKKFTNYNKFIDLPFVAPLTPITGTPTGTKGLDGWPDHLVERSIKYKVEMMETALLLAQQGDAVAFIPDFIARYVNDRSVNSKKLISISPPNKFKRIKRDIYIILRKNDEETPIIKKLAKSLRSIK